MREITPTQHAAIACRVMGCNFLWRGEVASIAIVGVGARMTVAANDEADTGPAAA